MRGTPFEFRFRMPISVLLYFMGFFAPWERFPAPGRVVPLWSWLSVELARTRLLSTDRAYLAVTLVAVLIMVAGAALRVWGTAYLGEQVVRDGVMHGRSVVAAGPYVHVRNPLYMGNYCDALGISVLMPATGALFFLITFGLFLLRLIGGEEAYLTMQLGEAYAAYQKRVPRLIPSLSARVATSVVTPRWTSALVGESFPVSAAICFAAVAWRYDVPLLARCLLICFGLSLVIRAATMKRSSA